MPILKRWLPTSERLKSNWTNSGCPAAFALLVDGCAREWSEVPPATYDKSNLCAHFECLRKSCDWSC
jgi:hypothetical protein